MVVLGVCKMRNFVKPSHCKIFGQSVGSDMQLMTSDLGVCWKFSTLRMIVVRWNFLVQHCGSKLLRTVCKFLQDFPASRSIRRQSLIVTLHERYSRTWPLRPQVNVLLDSRSRLSVETASSLSFSHTHTRLCLVQMVSNQVLCPQLYSFLTNFYSTKP